MPGGRVLHTVERQGVDAPLRVRFACEEPLMIERRMILWLFAACWCVLLLIHHGGLSDWTARRSTKWRNQPSTSTAWTSALDSIPRQA
jgi:hypothetical protein